MLCIYFILISRPYLDNGYDEDRLTQVCFATTVTQKWILSAEFCFKNNLSARKINMNK